MDENPKFLLNECLKCNLKFDNSEKLRNHLQNFCEKFDKQNFKEIKENILSEFEKQNKQSEQEKIKKTKYSSYLTKTDHRLIYTPNTAFEELYTRFNFKTKDVKLPDEEEEGSDYL